jgi:hypothetical protein
MRHCCLEMYVSPARTSRTSWVLKFVQSYWTGHRTDAISDFGTRQSKASTCQDFLCDLVIVSKLLIAECATGTCFFHPFHV